MADKEAFAEFLFQAIYSGNLEVVEEIVNYYGLSYCQEWAEGYTLLYDAVKKGPDEIAKFLTQKGAKVFYKNGTDVTTPLHVAVEKKSLQLIEVLIYANAMIDTENQEYCRHFPSLLCSATKRGAPDILRCILNGAGNCSINNEMTLSVPLFIACTKGFTEIAHILLDYRTKKGIFSLKPLHVALALAANQGSVDLVSLLLNAGADPNVVLNSHDMGGWCSHMQDDTCFPLHAACVKGHVGVAELLLRSGAQSDSSRHGDNYKPLHLACIYGHLRIVELLLKFEVDLNAKANENETPLHVAAKTHECGISEKVKIVELLVDNGANVGARTFHGLTPLSLAAEYGFADVAKVLLQRGACVNTRDNCRRTPLYLAVDKGSSSVVHLFLQYNPYVDEEIKKKVINIVINGLPINHLEMIDVFFEYRSIFNREDLNDPSLLLAAVYRGYAKVVECILSFGLDRKDKICNPTLLHVAVGYGHLAVIKSLLKSGYDVNATDKEGYTPIRYCMSCGDKGKWIEIFNLLLANGAFVQKASTLLHEAIDRESFELCKLLIENGNADVNAPNARGQTPLLIIASKRDSDVNHEAGEGEKKVQKTVRAEIAQLLLRKGADPHCEAEDGNTALHVAALNGNTEIVRVLLHFGAYVNSRVEKANFIVNSHVVEKRVGDGRTPLHISAEKGYAEVLKVLLEFEADIDIREGSLNQTALHCAVSRDHCEVVRVLLENGCDINIENSGKKTALDLAISKAQSACTYEIHYATSLQFEDIVVSVPINPEDHAVSNLLKMQAIKLRVAGLHVNEKILQQMNDNPTVFNFQEKCEKELKKLKSKKLCCHLTLYNFLVGSKNLTYMKNKSFRQIIESSNFLKYPIYGSLIVNSVEKSKQKIELLNPGKESLDIIMKASGVFSEKKLPILLDEVSEEIFSYLSNGELKNLISAGESVKNQVCN